MKEEEICNQKATYRSRCLLQRLKEENIVEGGRRERDGWRKIGKAHGQLKKTRSPERTLLHEVSLLVDISRKTI